MPSTEQIWRNPKRMHAVFAVSSLVMLFATIWMFTDDHAREYKHWQKASRKIDQWTVRARLAEQNSYPHAAALVDRKIALALAQIAPFDRTLIDDFKKQVDAANRGPAGSEVLDGLYDRLQKLWQADQLQKVAAAARESRAKLGLASAYTAGYQARADLDAAGLAAKELAEAAQAEEIVRVRGELLGVLDTVVKRAKLDEDNLSRKEKFRKAFLTEAISEHGIAVHKGRPIDAIQARIDRLKEQVANLDDRLSAAAERHQKLAAVGQQIQAPEDDARKQLNQVQADVKRLDASRQGPWQKFGDFIIRQPIVDAFYNSADIGVEQVWLPNLTINYNFSDVARFDRCANCHRAIDKSAPGSSVVPALQPEQRLTITLDTPAEDPEGPDDGEQAGGPLAYVYGFKLADTGRSAPHDVTVQFVWPGTLALHAGLAMGDVIEKIGDAGILKAQQVDQYLLGDSVTWGEPVTLSIRRGLPQPFVSHPRLDLFVGSLSPHKKEEFGCTICHDGQGSATSFKWSSHSPNTPQQADQWHRQHGWFNNSHWIYPMYPKRFLESGCLKCHHEVTELDPSPRFPDPPAPKLVRGYRLIRTFGCFGCHQINGYDGPNRRIGPDLRVEPVVHEAAYGILQDGILQDKDLSDEHGWAETLVQHPEDDQVRRRLFEAIAEDAKRMPRLTAATRALGAQLAKDAKPPLTAAQVAELAVDILPDDRLTDEEREWALTLVEQPDDEDARSSLVAALAEDGKRKPLLAARTHELGALLKDTNTPGALGKVGPSLRFVASKVDFPFLVSWIRKPADFRPTTRMPQFFGLWEHLQGQGLDLAKRYEPVEVRAIARYLLDASQSFTPLDPPAGVTAAASVERGKKLFQVRGCLACHAHDDFPEIRSQHGPDLSRIGAKLNTPQGRRWLYSWLRQPNRYHVRTKMANLLLEPIRAADGTVTDPAADIAEFLLASAGWKLTGAVDESMTAAETEALGDLALEYLGGTFPKRRAREYLEKGIPVEMAPGLKGAEVVLVGLTAENRIERQLEYVGRRAITKYGCSGCHDIPGFEDAKPIGTTQANWGRKDPSKLAFTQVAQFLASHGLDGTGQHGRPGHGGEPAAAASHGLVPTDYDPDTGYFVAALNDQSRQGFIWQKLRMPRSYDYMMTENKGYNERLRMPKFTFNALDPQANAADREAIITFVLGLVAEPPADQYVFHPAPRRKAVVQGRKVLEKYNCTGCHILRMPQWQFDYAADQFEEPVPSGDFPFLEPHFTVAQIQQSLQVDHRGLLHANLHGMPMVDENSGQALRLDEDGVPIDEDDDESEAYYAFALWQPALINGAPRPAGLSLALADSGLKRNPALGGDLARYLYPVVIADEKQVNPQAKGSEAWGWLPPPLVGEGRKIQPEWLYDFLLDPRPIRPAVLLRMPKFGLAPDEARAIVDYFAAIDDAPYPYEFDLRQRDRYLADQEGAHPGRMDAGLGVVLNRNYCVQCHLVGDFVPKGSPRALAPNLANVHRRLRPQFVRNWIANPKRTLPYTGMPINVPFANGIPQEFFKGTSMQQLDVLVDLLMNFDRYLEGQTSIQARLPAAAAPAQDEAPAQDKAPAAPAEDEQAAK